MGCLAVLSKFLIDNWDLFKIMLIYVETINVMKIIGGVILYLMCVIFADVYRSLLYNHSIYFILKDFVTKITLLLFIHVL